MRKYPIVRDYKDQPLAGTLNMKEKTNFLCSKMMDIEDTIRIRSKIDTDTYDHFKKEAITSLVMDKNQTKQEEDTLTKWIFTFDSVALLREYLYNEMFTENPHSVFNSILDIYATNNKLSMSCFEYIDANVLNRYKVKEFIMWAQYYELKLKSVPGYNNLTLFKKTPTYHFSARPIGTLADIDKQKQTISSKDYSDGTTEIGYKQTKSSQYFTYVYYYDVIYERI